MRFPPSLSGIIASLVLLFAINARTQAQLAGPQRSPRHGIQDHAPREAPVTALPVGKFKLLSPGTGWVLAGDRVLLTTDSGAHWQDVPHPPHGFGDVFFLDAKTAWVLGNEGGGDRECKFNISSTVDGGGLAYGAIHDSGHRAGLWSRTDLPRQ